MQEKYSFKKNLASNKIAKLKEDWIKSLTSPQDGMWESFRDNSTHWEIRDADKLIGYTCVDDKNELLQFYIIPKYLSEGVAIFKKYIEETGIKKGIVATNNPIYLSIALSTIKDIELHTYLFRENHAVTIEEKEGVLRECQKEDIERIVAFCYYSIEAPIDWLKAYISGLVEKGEIFVFEKEDEIIGICEVRKSKTAPKFADIGMIVSPDYRKKGYGTFLLNQAKQIAKEWKKEPICSCEKDNTGSFKSISNCGFVSMHQLFSITFKCVDKREKPR